MMAIEMSGGVYCPLSPRDPRHRLHELVHQTQSQLVLTQFLTKTKFEENIFSLDIDSVLINSDTNKNIDLDQFLSLEVLPNNIAYIIYTSGSTGTPKPVSSHT